MSVLLGLLLSIPIGKYLVWLYKLDRNEIEKAQSSGTILNKIGININEEMNWKEYLISMCLFSFFGFLILQIILMSQKIPFFMAFNIAMSFMTNTNWQNYAGESTLTNWVQSIGLGVQNFTSAASGFAILLCLIRGITKRENSQLGNFWNDIIKFTFHILLPLSIVFSLFLVWQGTPQTNKNKMDFVSLEGKKVSIPVGPVASQVAIKMLGSNGGGFYNANASHPYENPTPLSNFIQTMSIILLPAACMFMFIFSLPNRKQGFMILSVMLALLIGGLWISYIFQNQVNPLTNTHFLEGTETRFSPTECGIWATLTTAVTSGSVNCMHSSISPMTQLVALFNMMTGGIIFGGVGSGVYTMILYVLLSAFLSGLMVGRTPEYLGKKIQANEIIWVGLALLTPGLMNLLLSALAMYLSPATANHTPHGLSEILYAFSSAFGNNGSAFAGLNANTDFYNISLGFSMLFGRFIVIMGVLYIAGSLGLKNMTPSGPGTLKTDTVLFSFILLSVIIIVGALTFFPVLVLGPISEHLLMKN